jgi:ribosomal protein S18 acetylase RimI-like enzyme
MGSALPGGDPDRQPGRLRTVAAGPARDAYWALLLLADDSETQVRAYYQRGDLYVLDDAGGQPLGIVLALPVGDGEVELKAVAVAPERQGRGIGKHLLALVLADVRARGVRRVVLGTGNSGIGQLAFYQKAGFRLWRIERDVFTPERGYPPGLEENGIPLRDMVWLEQALD